MEWYLHNNCLNSEKQKNFNAEDRGMKKLRREKNQWRNACLVILSFLLNSSNAGAVTFDWITVGNAGNPADTEIMTDMTTGYGSVAYEYQISKYEVTTAQYVEFLNAVAATDIYGLYNENMYNSDYYKGIKRTGSSGSYVYSVNTDFQADWANKPVVFVSWYDTLRFTNWLQNGQPTGGQDASTTEDGAYDMSLGVNVVRKVEADVWLPSEDEWYKAAYYSPAGVYYDYATGMDTLPGDVPPGSDTGNSANYNLAGGSPYYKTDVGAYSLSESPYGTYDQNGNAAEWNEALIGANRGRRGASWVSPASYLIASERDGGLDPMLEHTNIGFRVAGALGETTIPEPASLGLVAISLLGAYRRARRM